MKRDSFGIYREVCKVGDVEVEFRGGEIDPFVRKFCAFNLRSEKKIINRDYIIDQDQIDDEGGFEIAFENHVVRSFEKDLEWRDKAKKLMLLGGIRYLLPVIKAAHDLGVYVITAPRIAPASQLASLGGYDYLPDNIAHKYSDEYVNVSILDRESVLKEQCNVFSRRYFYPLLTDFAPCIYGKGGCPIAEDMGRCVLTLPTYYGLKPEEATEIAVMIKEIVK